MDENVLILVGYSHHSDDEVMLDALRAIAFMTTNADYPTPPVLIPALQLLLNAFTIAVVNASSGGTELTALKNEKRIPLTDAMTLNGGYVQVKCGNIRSKALGSGYYLGSTNTTKIGPLAKIALIKFSDGLNPGQTKMKAKLPDGASGLIWKFTQGIGPSAIWTTETSSRGTFTAKNLTSGGPLRAKVAGNGADEEKVWSEEFTYPTVR